MYLLSLIVLAPALGLLVWLLLARARRRKKALAASPTVLGQPTTVRPLNAGERAAYRILVEALPRGYLLLSQVALARFIKVSERTSYRAWYDRVGHRCVDFVVCNGEGELVAVVELDEQVNRGARYQQFVQRKARVLDHAGVPVLQWASNDLPSVEQAREALEQAAILGGLRARQRVAQPSANMPLSDRKRTEPSPRVAQGKGASLPWRDPPSAVHGPHVGDTVPLENSGVRLSASEQQALGRLLGSRTRV